MMGGRVVNRLSCSFVVLVGLIITQHAYLYTLLLIVRTAFIIWDVYCLGQ